MAYNIPQWTLFRAAYGSSIANATGDGTLVVFPFDSTSINVKNCFSSNTFTAPVTGRYRFEGMVTVNVGAAVGMTTGSIQVIVNGSANLFFFTNPLAIKDGNNNLQLIIPSVSIALSAGGTISLGASVGGGTKTASVGNSDTRANFFTGYLIS